MLNIPSALQPQFETCLQNTMMPKHAQAAYTKWPRYYLDFCQKYHFPHAQRESLPHFLHKLQEKTQTKAQQQQASHAISLYYELVHDRGSHTEIPSPKKANPPGKVLEELSPRPDALRNETNITNISQQASSLGKAPPEPSPKTVSFSHKTNTATGVSWKTRYTRLVNEIQVRHYSPKTLKAYTQWVLHFQTFTLSQDPEWLSSADVKDFLTFLTVTKKVSASTQNQAFNALLFFYRHVLNQEFGTVQGVIRAKRKPYVPVVLSRAEMSVHEMSPDAKWHEATVSGCKGSSVHGRNLGPGAPCSDVSPRQEDPHGRTRC